MASNAPMQTRRLRLCVYSKRGQVSAPATLVIHLKFKDVGNPCMFHSSIIIWLHAIKGACQQAAEVLLTAVLFVRVTLSPD